MHPIARRAALPLGALAAIAAAACSGAPTTPESSSALLAPAGPSYLGSPTPPPPTPPPPPPPPIVPEDSVVGGYGTESTGGTEHLPFEYEPETGTEYVVTPDTSAAERGLTPTAPK
jgi:hypothetical protein